jgi:hypothetical protein
MDSTYCKDDGDNFCRFWAGIFPRHRMISNQTGYLSDGSEIIRPDYDER